MCFASLHCPHLIYYMTSPPKMLTLASLFCNDRDQLRLYSWKLGNCTTSPKKIGDYGKGSLQKAILFTKVRKYYPLEIVKQRKTWPRKKIFITRSSSLPSFKSFPELCLWKWKLNLSSTAQPVHNLSFGLNCTRMKWYKNDVSHMTVDLANNMKLIWLKIFQVLIVFFTEPFFSIAPKNALF